MNTSDLVTEFVELQTQQAAGKLSVQERSRWKDLRQALTLAEVSLSPADSCANESPARFRIHNGEAIREHEMRLSKPEVELELNGAVELGSQRVAVIEPGPGLPAFVSYARVLEQSQRGPSWYRLTLE